MERPLTDILVVGNSKVGWRLLRRLPLDWGGVVLRDGSTSLFRVWRLVRSRRLPLGLLARMVWAEIRRSDAPFLRGELVASNAEVLAAIKEVQAKRVLLFYVGLVLSREVIEAVPDALNVHCARLPTYGGIGAIASALKRCDWHQEATLHRVTTRLDGGEVVDAEPYDLSPHKGYSGNEEVAYEAGIRLVLRALGMRAEDSSQERRVDCRPSEG